MNPIEGKTILVTGASRGIGRAIALRFAKAGAHLIVTARNQADLDSLANEIHALGRRCLAIAADLADPDQLQELAQKALASGQIDVLVNNAGVGSWAPIQELTLRQLNDMLDVNVRAVFLLSQALCGPMVQRGTGHIINITSTSSHVAYPEGTAYCASKFAALGFSEALARELRPSGVRVTAISPGQVNTYLGGGGPADWEEGMLNGEDIAELALQAISLPPHAIVTEMVVWPRAEEF